MSDEELRHLERRWLETESPSDEAALLRARLRRDLIDPLELRVRAALDHEPALAALGPERPARWDGIAAFVARWFEAPLAPALPAALARLTELEAQHGRLPDALREWLVLAHGRAGNPHAISFVPAPERLSVWAGRRVPVFGHSNDLFVHTLELDDPQEDPRVDLLGAPKNPRAVRTSQAIRAGLLYDVARAAANPYAHRDASFGRLHPTVRGAELVDSSPLERIAARWPALVPPIDPLYGGRPFGEPVLGLAPFFGGESSLHLHGEEGLLVACEHAERGGAVWIAATTQTSLMDAEAHLAR